MATWGEMNLGRFRNAQGALTQGSNAMMQGFQNLQKPLTQLTDIGAAAWQNELNRELQREMPDITAQSEINKQMGLLKERYGSLGLGEEGAAPPPVAKGEVEPPAVTRPDFIEPTGEGVETETVADGTKYPNQYAEDITGNKADWSKLKFIKDGKEVPYTEAWDPKTKKVLPGVVVDSSALAGKPSSSDMYAEFMAKNKMTPETYQEPPREPLEMPEAMKVPQEEPALPTPLAKTDVGKKYGRSWESEPGKGWLQGMEEYDLGMAGRKTYQEEIKWAEDYVDNRFPDLSAQQKYNKVLEILKGYRPIDYRDKGASFEDERKRRIEGSLSNLSAVEGGNWLRSPDGRAFFTQDPVNGGYKINEGVDPDEALARLADVVAKRSEPGISSTQFYHYTERGDWKKYMQDIQNPPEGMTKDEAVAKWRDEVIFPYLKDEITKKGFVGKEGAEEEGPYQYGGSQVGDVFLSTMGGPWTAIAEVWSTAKQGGPLPPMTEKAFQQKWNDSASFRVFNRNLGIEGPQAWEMYKEKVLSTAPDWAWADKKNPYRKTGGIKEFQNKYK
jgi:hypothetical protein